MRKTYLTAYFDDRTVTLGQFPNARVREYLKQGHSTKLWRELAHLCAEFYPNSTLETLSFEGDADHTAVVVENYRPTKGEAAIVAY